MNERLVLSNVKRINGEEMDLIIEKGMIAEISEAGEGQGNVLDCTGQYVSSGWIDLHVHAFPEFKPYGDDIDEIGVKQGVTTIVDAGSTGADRIHELAGIGKEAQTNLFAFLNISTIGLERIDELSNLNWINEQQALEAAETYRELVVGFKARISQSVVGNSGIEPLRIARKLSEQAGVPLMVHIGSGPPSIEEVIPLLGKRDIITHFLNGKANNLFDDEGKPLQVLTDAIGRGVHLDVGHGSASFSFEVAEQAKRHGVHFDTISTDIYRRNRLDGPVYSLANVLTKFLHLGYSLEEVIGAVTTGAAEWLQKPELGRIQAGDRANLTLFAVEDEKIRLVDSKGIERIAERKIETKGVVANGEYIKC